MSSQRTNDHSRNQSERTKVSCNSSTAIAYDVISAKVEEPQNYRIKAQPTVTKMSEPSKPVPDFQRAPESSAIRTNVWSFKQRVCSIMCMGVKDNDIVLDNLNSTCMLLSKQCKERRQTSLDYLVGLITLFHNRTWNWKITFPYLCNWQNLIA